MEVSDNERVEEDEESTAVSVDASTDNNNNNKRGYSTRKTRQTRARKQRGRTQQRTDVGKSEPEELARAVAAQIVQNGAHSIVLYYNIYESLYDCLRDKLDSIGVVFPTTPRCVSSAYAVTVDDAGMNSPQYYQEILRCIKHSSLYRWNEEFPETFAAVGLEQATNGMYDVTAVQLSQEYPGLYGRQKPPANARTDATLAMLSVEEPKKQRFNVYFQCRDEIPTPAENAAFFAVVEWLLDPQNQNAEMNKDKVRTGVKMLSRFLDADAMFRKGENCALARRYRKLATEVDRLEREEEEERLGGYTADGTTTSNSFCSIM